MSQNSVFQRSLNKLKYHCENCRGCIYATYLSGEYGCGYMLATGHSRDCDAEHCTRKDTDPEHLPITFESEWY